MVVMPDLEKADATVVGFAQEYAPGGNSHDLGNSGVSLSSATCRT
jgi:hypothetical protein